MKPVILTFVLVVLTTVVGCGGPKPSPVTGTVTYKGKGVPDVNVVLVAKDGTTASGVTDSSGKITKMTTVNEGDGAVPGDYTVTITAKTVATENPTADEYAPTDPSKLPFPPKYSDPAGSGLKATIPPGGTDLKFELTD
jgi:hypothetical protein